MFDLKIAKTTSLCRRKTALHDNNEKRLLPTKGLRLLGGPSWGKTGRGWGSFHSLAPHLQPRWARSDPDGGPGPTQPCATTPRTTWTQTWNCKEAFQTTGDYWQGLVHFLIFVTRYASLPTKMVSRRKPTLSNLVLPHRQPHHKHLVTSKPELR